MVKMLRSIIFLSVLLMLTLPVRANDGSWEYQVIILQGVMAGSTLEVSVRRTHLATRV